MNFENIGTRKGQGSPTSGYVYQFTDSQPNLLMSYYRIKEMDASGKVSYSRTISLKNENEVTLFPNPVNDNAYMSLPTGSTVDVQLLDIQGRVVSQYTQDTSLKAYDYSGVSSGRYILIVRDKTTGIVIRKIPVQKR